MKGSPPIQVQTLDISLRGVSLLVDTPLEAGKSCVIAFDAVLDGNAKRINIWGAIVYCKPCNGGYRVGVRSLDFDTMSMDYIKRLCEQGAQAQLHADQDNNFL